MRGRKLGVGRSGGRRIWDEDAEGGREEVLKEGIAK